MNPQTKPRPKFPERHGWRLVRDNGDGTWTWIDRDGEVQIKPVLFSMLEDDE